MQVRQELARWSAQRGIYDQTFRDVYGFDPVGGDRDYAAVRIGDGWSIRDYRWNEAHSERGLSNLQTLVPRIMGRSFQSGDNPWRDRTADAIGSANLTFSRARHDLAFYPQTYDRVKNALYPSVLNRIGDEGGVKTAQNDLANGIDWETLRRRLASSTEAYNRIKNDLYPSVLNRAGDEGGVKSAQGDLARGESWEGVRRRMAFSTEAYNRIRNELYPAILDRTGDEGGVKTAQNDLARGVDWGKLRRRIAFSDEAYNRIRNGLYPATLDRLGDEGGVRNAQNALANGKSFSEIRRDKAFSEEARNTILRLGGAALGRPLSQAELLTYQNELADGRTLEDLHKCGFRPIVSIVFSNPSVDGPNLKMNTQGILNGQPEFYDRYTTLDGGVSSDWGVVQWSGQTPLTPDAGKASQVWDKNYGTSIGHWSQGSATSELGRTEFNVFRDPADGHYVYQMAAQGGELLDVQIATLGTQDLNLSFDHQVTASLVQGVSGYRGNTGTYQAGVNFTINYKTKNLSFGLFLQFESIDYTGDPDGYFYLPQTLGGSIFNVFGPTADYINPLRSENDGVMYKTTIDVNTGLMRAINALRGMYRDLPAEITDLRNWYLDGCYIGVETIGSGQISDVTGYYNVKDPVVSYDRHTNVSFSESCYEKKVVTMTKA
ncbi:hypothetical protein AA21291_2278 [Swaminathania salitolerans LMG 21291]|nr:hypothetical protein AA21291_2278 [Swaminathania salitolerans LMG 21291]